MLLATDELDAAFCLLSGEIPDDLAVERLSEEEAVAAVRWLGRHASERPDVQLDSVVQAADAFTRLRASSDAQTAVHTLRGLCR